MKIAVASGKGGTGKTLVATNLGHVASSSYTVTLYDLDVDEPNCHLFFPLPRYTDDTVTMMVPSIDKTKCALCGTCTDVCEFNAIIALPGEVLVFPEMCHSCYACLEMCPERAITEGHKDIGRICMSRSGSLNLVAGELRIGQPATTALIRRTKTAMERYSEINIYDSPPGTSCPVVESVKNADYVILVSEPTPFGLHDLDLIAQTMTLLQRPFGVVANKAVDGNRLIDEYCERRGIEIIGRIPYQDDIARTYAKGELVSVTMPDLRGVFENILGTVVERAKRVGA